MPTLEVKDLHAGIKGKEILKGVSLKVKTGEVHSIMGPNGSGKSTLASVIMGSPKYEVYSGSILLDGENVLEMLPDERARKGLFLAFQNSVEIPGVSISKFLYNALAATRLQDASARKNYPQLLSNALDELGLSEDFASRALNVGFSGGEKKRAEILQLSVLRPKMAILDEIDSGLDVDALKTVSKAIQKHASETGMLVITHYQRILKHLNPDFVHVMVDGRIVKSGGKQLAETIEEEGYENLAPLEKAKSQGGS